MDKNMINDPIISVILPVYNGEKYLKEAIDSILNQTYSDFELIILDDCSTDNTANIIKSYSDKRIRYVYNEKNLKIAASLNKGISLARGKYIARMDADDIALPYRFQKQIDIFKNNPNIDIVNIRFNIMSENGNNIRKFKYNISPSSNALKYLIHIDSFICHPGVMIKKEWYQKYKYKTEIDAYNVEDCELWLRMISNGAQCYTIKEPLLNYRINNQSVTHVKSGKELQIKNICNLYLNSIFSNFNLKLNITTLKLIKGQMTEENLLHINNFINELKKFESTIKKLETSTFIQKEIHSWSEYCKFRTLISIIKSNLNFSIKIKTSFIIAYNLLPSIIILIKEYINLNKQL